jgi:hypothetical protein
LPNADAAALFLHLRRSGRSVLIFKPRRKDALPIAM